VPFRTGKNGTKLRVVSIEKEVLKKFENETIGDAK
jgi:hypothetical protein